jgi:hypothetical protein
MAFAENQINTVSIGANVYIANNAFESSGNNYFSAEFYNNQGRRAGTYNISWRLVSAAAPQSAVQPAAQPARTGSNNTASASKPAKAASAESNGVFAGNGHRYEVIDNSITWTEAKEDCEKRGGYLVTITSKEEQTYIRQLIARNGKKGFYWMGGYVENKKWLWVTGEEFKYKNWLVTPTSANGTKVMFLRTRGTSTNTDHIGKWAEHNGEILVNDWNGFPGYICEWDAE